MGAPTAGRGADQGPGAGRSVSLRALRVRRSTGWYRLWCAGRLRLLDDRESAVLSALWGCGSAVLGAQRAVRHEPRLFHKPGRLGAWRGALRAVAPAESFGASQRPDAGDPVPRRA